MGNQRPPGGVDSPTEDPDRERNKPSGGAPPERHYAPAEFQPGSTPPQPWVDPERTQPYVPGRRSIAERLRAQSREPEAVPPPQPAAQPEQPPPAPPQPAAKPGWQARVQQRVNTPVRSASRASGGMRLAAILAGVVVLGLAAGAGAAWFSGWRPGFLAGKTDETKPPDTTSTTKPGEKPGDKPPETKPGEATPPATDLARSCFTARTEVKAGATACGFALEASGAVSFKGQRITDRLAAGAAPAQRLLLYPFSASGRFVFLRACAAAGGGRCVVQRLVDTKEKKLFDVKGDADDLLWVAFSPKEEVGLLGYRDGTADSVAAIATADGKLLLSAAIKSKRNEYAMVRERSLRWPNEDSFSIEVKLCAFERGGRNTKCEQDEKVRFRRRLVKLAR